MFSRRVSWLVWSVLGSLFVLPAQEAREGLRDLKKAVRQVGKVGAERAVDLVNTVSRDDSAAVAKALVDSYVRLEAAAAVVERQRHDVLLAGGGSASPHPSSSRPTARS